MSVKLQFMVKMKFCLVFPKDRAERAARFAKSKEEAEAAKAAALQAKQAELEARKEASQKERR